MRHGVTIPTLQPWSGEEVLGRSILIWESRSASQATNQSLEALLTTLCTAQQTPGDSVLVERQCQVPPPALQWLHGHPSESLLEGLERYHSGQGACLACN